MRPKLTIFANPRAGAGRVPYLSSVIGEYLRNSGCQVHIEQPGNRADFLQLARSAAQSGETPLVALGGDGTFHDLVEATAGLDVVLGLLPAGSGNDIASGLGIPLDPLAAAQALLREKPRPVDVLRVVFGRAAQGCEPHGGAPLDSAIDSTGRVEARSVISESLSDGSAHLYVGAGGLGLDAETAHLAHTRYGGWHGLPRYLLSAATSLKNFRALQLDALIDGRVWRGRVLLAAVANSASYGAGIRIAPGAQMDDGWLDVTLVRPMPWPDLCTVLTEALVNRNWSSCYVCRLRARCAVFRADRRARFQGDGELLGATPLRVEVLPRAIRVMAPAGFLR